MKLYVSLLIILLAVAGAIGFALGYWIASPSSLISTLDPGSDRVEKARYEAIQESLKESEKTAREAQEEARNSRQQAEIKVQTARKEGKRTWKKMRVEQARLEQTVSDLEKRAATAEEEEEQARMELEEAFLSSDCDFSDRYRQLTTAHSNRISIFQEEIHGLRLVVSSQETTISALRDEVIALDLLTTDLRRENGALTKCLEISGRQFEEAERRIRQLSGRRLRIRPAALLGAFRGMDSGWSPGVGIGIALTW